MNLDMETTRQLEKLAQKENVTLELLIKIICEDEEITTQALLLEAS